MNEPDFVGIARRHCKEWAIFVDARPEILDDPDATPQALAATLRGVFKMGVESGREGYAEILPVEEAPGLYIGSDEQGLLDYMQSRFGASK